MEQERFIARIINCKNCSLCCNKVSVFILSDEIAKMRELHVPLIKIEDRYFVKQNRNGVCPNLTADRKCKIYDQRPIACRLHPFYLMNRRGVLKTWVKYTYCPEENKILKDVNNIDTFKLLVFELEKNFSSEQILEMLKSDEVNSKYDQLETGARAYNKIINLARHT